MLGLVEHGAAAFAAASGDELGVPPGNRRNQSEADAGEAAPEPGAMRGAAMGRVYAALWRAAEAGQPCPGNRELGALAGIVREAKVQRALRALVRKRLIVVERSAEDGGERRVVIRASGRATGWSLRERGPVEAEGSHPTGGGGMRALGSALKRAGQRFVDVTPAEARRIARDTPADPGLPAPPAPASYAGCALAALVRPDPPEGEDAAAAAVP